MEHLLEEAQNLADGGVKELILVAQETTMYGTDLYGEKRLPQLLRALCKISGLRWIRILYCPPEGNLRFPACNSLTVFPYIE